jgi:hypothetical protein
MRQGMRVLTVSLSALALGIAVQVNSAIAQTAAELVGAWKLVSVSNTKDGVKTDAFGTNPNGLYIFSNTGRFSIINMRAELPKFASNNRMQGTAEENKAIVQGSLALFGTYSVADKVLTMKVDGSTWPAWIGTEQKRTMTMSGDEIKWELAATVGGTAEVVIRRIK